MLSDVINNKPIYKGDSFLGCRELYQSYNAIVNEYLDRSEVLLFNSDRVIRRKGYVQDESKKHPRNFSYDGGVLHRRSINATIDGLLKSLKRSRNRSLDSFYNYVMANDWRYFVTLTFSSDKVDRSSRSAIKHCWKLFRQRLNYYFPAAYCIAVPEPHKDGKLHFHGLIGGCDLSDWLKPAVDPEGEIIKSSFGDTIYNLVMYEYGFSTVIDLGEDPCKLRVTNYLAKYLTKTCSVYYNEKSYYRSHGLKCRLRHYLLLSDSDKDCMLSVYSARRGENFTFFSKQCQIYERKQKDNFCVYDVIYLE